MKFNETIEITKNDKSLIIKEDRESFRNLTIITFLFSFCLFFVIYSDFDFFINIPYNSENFIMKCVLLFFLNMLIPIIYFNFIPYFKIEEFKMDKKSIIRTNKSYKSEMIITKEINTSDLKRAKLSVIKNNNKESTGYNILILELKNKEEVTLFSNLPLYELRNISREINIFINCTYKNAFI